MKMVNSATTSVRAPLPRVRAGFVRPWPDVHQLRHVLGHPLLDVIPAHQMAEPPPAVLRVAHVARQVIGQVGDPVGQRVAERQRQAEEHQQPPDDDDRHRQATALDLPALESDHERVQQHGDEGGHDHEQDDVPQVVEHLGGHIDQHHHRGGGEDGPQRDAP